jgi:AcrR family transcriptional regulator
MMPAALSSIPDQIPLFFRHKEDDAQLRLTMRHRIMGIAKQRFARFSYDGTSLASIARSAGVSLPELLTHFDDKIGLLTAVFDEGWGTINTRFMDIVVNSVTARDAMLSMLKVMKHILERDEDLSWLLLFESRRPSPHHGEVMFSRGYLKFMGLCTELAVRGQRDGSFKTVYHPRIIASILVGAAENLLRDKLLSEQENGGDARYPDEQLTSAFEALVAYLKP